MDRRITNCSSGDRKGRDVQSYAQPQAWMRDELWYGGAEAGVVGLVVPV
jgi:hypothetical protein